MPHIQVNRDRSADSFAVEQIANEPDTGRYDVAEIHNPILEHRALGHLKRWLKEPESVHLVLTYPAEFIGPLPHESVLQGMLNT